LSIYYSPLKLECLIIKHFHFGHSTLLDMGK
jgi:hypothetical protein